MRRGARVLGRAAAFGSPRRERRREALVVRLDGYAEDFAERGDEALRLARLFTVLPAKRQGKPDDDALGPLPADQLADPWSPAGVAARSMTPRGVAIVPVASETATPVRAAP